MYRRFLFLMALLTMLLLVACGAEEQLEQAATDIAPTLQAAATDIAPTLEAAATEVMEQVTEVAPTLEAAATEIMEAATEAAPTDEPAAAGDPFAGMGDCAPAADGDFAGVDPRGQTITWWHNHSGSREENMLPLLDQFNETNPCGITLVAENQGGYNDIRDKVNAASAAGEQPAALVVGYQNDQAFYQLNESLVDLDPYLDDPHWGWSEAEQADFYQSFFNQSIHPLFDDARLGLPPNRSMEVMFYNQTWLEELGFSGPPTTPDEFSEMACAASEANGDGTGGYILRDDASAVAAWTYAFGGDVLSEDQTSYVYNSQATVDAMAFLKQLYDDGCAYFFTEGFPNPEFANRRAIFAQGSSSGIPFYAGDIATVAEEQGREPDVWGVAAIPHTTAEPVQNIYGGDVMITNTSPEQQLAAWIFAKWFTSPAVQAEWVRISGYFPTRASSQELIGDYREENPQWAQSADMLPFAYYEPQLISYQGVRDAATGAFNEIMQGADIQETLDELTETANELEAELLEEAGG